MRIIDPKFKHNAGRYVFQCTLAALTILLVLAFLDVLTHTIIVATLGATTFITFAMPHSYYARPRRLIGGYVVGSSVGCICNCLCALPLVISTSDIQRATSIGFAALAVGIAILLMVATDTEHAPAAGMALGLVLNKWDYRTILFTLCAVTLLTVGKQVLKPMLIDLI